MTAEMTKSDVIVSKYQGKPTISLGVGTSRFPFTFGAAKAALIIKHLDAIRQFAADNPVADPAPLTAEQRENLRKWRNVAKSGVMDKIIVKQLAIKAGLPETAVDTMLDQISKVR